MRSSIFVSHPHFDPDRIRAEMNTNGSPSVRVHSQHKHTLMNKHTTWYVNKETQIQLCSTHTLTSTRMRRHPQGMSGHKYCTTLDIHTNTLSHSDTQPTYRVTLAVVQQMARLLPSSSLRSVALTAGSSVTAPWQSRGPWCQPHSYP